MAYGMFGPDTADIQATLDAENWQKRYKGDSLEDSVGNLFQSGFGLAAKAMGAEDPRMSKAKKMEEVKRYAQENAKGNDTISYYKSLSEAFKKFGMIEEAMNIEKVIAQLEDKDLNRAVKQEQIAATRETRLAAINARTQGKDPKIRLDAVLKDVFKDASVASKKASYAIVAAGGTFEDALAVLEQDGGKEAGEKYIGLTRDGQAVFSTQGIDDTYIKVDGKKVPIKGGIAKGVGTPGDATSNKITIEDARQGTAVAAETFGNAVKTGIEARNTISAVQSLKGMATKAKDYFGPTKNIADAVATLNRLMGTQIKGSNEKEVVELMLKDIQLGKAANMKGSLSDNDLKFLVKSVADRGFTFEGFMSALNMLEEKAARENEYGRIVSEERRGGKKLEDIDFYDAQERAHKRVTEKYGKRRDFDNYVLQRKQADPKWAAIWDKASEQEKEELYNSWKGK